MRTIVSRVGVIVGLSAAALTALVAQETAAVYQGQAAEDFLLKAKIMSTRPIGEGVTRPLLVTLTLDGVTRQAVFKSIDERKAGVTVFPDGSSDIDFQDSWQTEISAYIVDRIIGLGMVPATVKRRVVGVGSLQWFVQGIKEAERLEKKLVAPDAEAWSEQLFKARLFDQLIANVDRHLSNILITKEFTLRLIDHSRAFRMNKALKDPDSLQRFSRSLLEGIKKLEKKDLQQRAGEYLTTGQIDRLLQRRDAILEVARTRVAEKGEAAVLYK